MRDAAQPLSPEALDAPRQIGLFAPSSAAVDALAGIDPDALTPTLALEALYRLKSLASAPCPPCTSTRCWPAPRHRTRARDATARSNRLPSRAPLRSENSVS